MLYNELEDAKVERLYRVAPNKVIFIIRLSDHPNLRNPDVIRTSMAYYMARYPNAYGWEAQITELSLYITVVGEIG